MGEGGGGGRLCVRLAAGAAAGRAGGCALLFGEAEGAEAREGAPRGVGERREDDEEDGDGLPVEHLWALREA